MGGHLHACPDCLTSQFVYHSCNHRACPQCGHADTAEWVDAELCKRVGAPYFMVNFTLPAELRELFFTPLAREVYDVFFAAAAQSLREVLANRKWLGAQQSGFTFVLQTWNQRLLFHPHIHAIVPGAGVDTGGKVVTVKNPKFLVPQGALSKRFAGLFRQKLEELHGRHPEATLPEIAPGVWWKDWGTYLQPFGNGATIIKYLGRYVCRTAIGDSRIVGLTEETVSFTHKDRDAGERRVETVSGLEFVERYLRHVLPLGLRSIRRYGFCHPAGKRVRQRIAFHTGLPLVLEQSEPAPAKPPYAPECPCCRKAMEPAMRVLARWRLQQLIQSRKSAPARTSFVARWACKPACARPPPQSQLPLTGAATR